MGELNDVFHKSGVSRARRSVETIRQLDDLSAVVDPNRKITPSSLPSSTPLDPSWGPGDALKRYPMPRAGHVAILDAICLTPPSTGDALITMSKTTRTAGTETIATVRIPKGSQFADLETLVWQSREVEARSWLSAVVTTANGAAGVSIGATLEINR